MLCHIIAAQQDFAADRRTIVSARQAAVNRWRIKRPHRDIGMRLLPERVSPTVGIVKLFAGLAELDTGHVKPTIARLHRSTAAQKSQGQEKL